MFNVSGGIRLTHIQRYTHNVLLVADVDHVFGWYAALQYLVSPPKSAISRKLLVAHVGNLYRKLPHSLNDVAGGCLFLAMRGLSRLLSLNVLL